jgi:UDP-glucose 4-epimerase
LDDAVDLVMFAFKNGKNGDIFVQKAPATTIEVLAKTLVNMLNKPKYTIKIIGTRHGEKLYETLLTREEMLNAQDMDDYYRICADNRDLNYNKYFVDGEVITEATDYHSHNTQRLDEEQMQVMISKLHEVQSDLKEFGVI